MFTVALEVINVLGNPIDECSELSTTESEGLHILERAMLDRQKSDDPTIGSICVIVPGQESVDWSHRNFTPLDCKIFAADLKFGENSDALSDLNLDSNPISGSIPHHGDFKRGIDVVDADLSGFRVLCTALKRQHLVAVSLRSCALGSAALCLLADCVKDMLHLHTLNLSDNPAGDQPNEEGRPGMAFLLEHLKHIALAVLDISDTGAGPTSTAMLGGILCDNHDGWSHQATRSATIGCSLTSLNVSGCALTGGKKEKGIVQPLRQTSPRKAGSPRQQVPGSPVQLADNGEDAPIAALSRGLLAAQITHVSLSNCGLSPTCIHLVASHLIDPRGDLEVLTVDATGTGHPGQSGQTRAYTLDVADATLTLRGQTLGSADACLSAA